MIGEIIVQKSKIIAFEKFEYNQISNLLNDHLDDSQMNNRLGNAIIKEILELSKKKLCEFFDKLSNG